MSENKQVKRSDAVEAGIQAMDSAFIDVTLHAQTAFKIVAYIKQLEAAVLSASAGEKSLDNRNRKVGKAMMRAASMLPELWAMKIEIEQGYGGVKLVRPDGCKIDFEHDGGQFSDIINHATDYALNSTTNSMQSTKEEK